MKKSIWIFLLAVFLPGAVLGWLALLSAGEQQIIFERRTAELYQKETEDLAAAVRETLESERRAFSDVVHRLLGKSDAEELARDFTNTLNDAWQRKAIGFAISADGKMLSPGKSMVAKDEGCREFLWNNGAFLCSVKPAMVYPVPITSAEKSGPNVSYSSQLRNRALSMNEQAQVPGQQVQVQRQLSTPPVPVTEPKAEPAPEPQAMPAMVVSKGGNDVVLVQKSKSDANEPQPKKYVKEMIDPKPGAQRDAGEVRKKTKPGLSVEGALVADEVRKQEEMFAERTQIQQKDRTAPGGGGGEEAPRRSVAKEEPAVEKTAPENRGTLAERPAPAAASKPRQVIAPSAPAAPGIPLAPAAPAPSRIAMPAPGKPAPDAPDTAPAAPFDSAPTASIPPPRPESGSGTGAVTPEVQAPKIALNTVSANAAPNLNTEFGHSNALQNVKLGGVSEPGAPEGASVAAKLKNPLQDASDRSADASKQMIGRSSDHDAARSIITTDTSLGKGINDPSQERSEKRVPGFAGANGTAGEPKSRGFGRGGPIQNAPAGIADDTRKNNDGMRNKAEVPADKFGGLASASGGPQPGENITEDSVALRGQIPSPGVFTPAGSVNANGTLLFNRQVVPVQNLRAQTVNWSAVVPATTEFRALTENADEGMISRFVQDKLGLIFWIRPPESPDIVFGCLIEAAALQDLWKNILGTGNEPKSGDGKPGFILALLDDKARPVTTYPNFDGVRDWKHPFVASEVGEALPHWETALYLATPTALADSARGLGRTINFTIVAAVALIALGGWLVVADVRRQLALAQKKTDFVSNVSHELKTPLTSIRMFAELMHDRPPPVEKQGQYLRIITAEAERLTRLINNVLDFAKLERRQKRFEKGALDLHAAIVRVWEGHEMHLRDAGFTTKWEAAPGPYPVTGDEDALAQILVNLLSNAEKYSNERKEVELVTWMEDGHINVSVLDRGMGVPDGEERKIFESFYRAHDSLSSGIQGSGLGLTLAQRLASEHGGEIVFERRKDGGSRFTLRLPLADGQEREGRNKT
jgi:signal transduction histidine kinase